MNFVKQFSDNFCNYILKFKANNYFSYTYAYAEEQMLIKIYYYDWEKK